MNHFFKVNDVLPLDELVDKALNYAKYPYEHAAQGQNKTVGLVFFNSSLRTRLSSIRAAQNLGANVWLIDVTKDGWKLEFDDGIVMNQDKAEHIQEAIQVMSSYCDVLGVRAFPKLLNRDDDYNEVLFNRIISYSNVPVVNLESGTRHPLQSLADLVTMKQVFEKKEKLNVVLSWAPHPRRLPQSVPNSFAEWCNAADWINLTIAAPKGYELAEEFSRGATCTTNQQEAFSGADIIYAKNWSSFSAYGTTPAVDDDWMITQEKMALTNNGKFMHCLPVRRNCIVSDEVMNSDQSIVIQQAKNRIFSAQAVFSELLRHN